jgi:hypothetical protein
MSVLTDEYSFALALFIDFFFFFKNFFAARDLFF